MLTLKAYNMRNCQRSSSETKFQTEKKKYDSLNNKLQLINHRIKSKMSVITHKSYSNKDKSSRIDKVYFFNLKNIISSLYYIKKDFVENLRRYLFNVYIFIKKIGK